MRDRPGLRGRASAYMTVEAAYIVPFVLMFILLSVSLSFLLYDRCAAVQECYVRAYRESIRKCEAAPGDSSAEGWTTYVAVRDLSFTTEKGKYAVAAAEGTVLTPVSFAVWSEGGDPFTFRTTMRARITDPPQSFRKCRRALALISAVKELGEN